MATSGGTAGAASTDALPGGVASSGSGAINQVSPLATKSRPGKTVNVGGARTVRYYRLTDHELDFLSDPQKEAAQARAVGSFALALLITTVANFSFSKPTSEVVEGVWIAVGALSLIATIYYNLRGLWLGHRAKSRRRQIEDQHDFSGT